MSLVEGSIVKTNECSNVCFTWFAQLIMENSLENYILTYIMTLSVLTLQEKY